MSDAPRRGFAARPGAATRDPDAWVRAPDSGSAAPPSASRADLYPARLTIDVTRDLRARIKIAAFAQGITVADMLRALLKARFPEQDEPR